MRIFRKHAATIVVAMITAAVTTAAPAIAGSGIGGIFNLGKTNKVAAQSTLKGAVNSRNLQITNTGSGSGLGITVGSGKAPLTVNAAAGKATNLNVDELDGFDSSVFQHSCDAGAFLASGYIDSSTITGSFSTTGLLDSYSCLGAVQVRKAGTGLYDVKFANVTTSGGIFPTTYTPRAIATSRSTNNDVADTFTYEDTTNAPGYILLELANIDPSTGNFVDGPIDFVVTDVNCAGIFCSIIIATPQHHAGTGDLHQNGTHSKRN